MTVSNPLIAGTVPAYAHGGNFTPVFHVVHSTEGPMSDGNAKALADWFARSPANGGPGTSATDIFDPIAGWTMLADNVVPYHCGPAGNGLSTGSEHCGSVDLTAAQWMSAKGQAMLDRSAKRTAQRLKARGYSLAEIRWLSVPQVAARNVKGLCTHNDVRLALGGTTHSDPGPNFPYTWYIGRVRAWYSDPVNGGEEWSDMATQAEVQAACESASRKVWREEIGAAQSGAPTSRTAMFDLIVRVVNSALGNNSINPATGERFVIDTTAVGVGSPARTGIDQIIESSSAVTGVKNDVEALATNQETRLTAIETTLEELVTAVGALAPPA